MLCSKCQAIAPKIHDGYAHKCLIRHHSSFGALIESAKNRCELCQLMRPAIEGILKKEDPEGHSNGGSGWTYEDPFKDPYPDRRYMIMGDANEKYGSWVYYVDYGTHFELHGQNCGSKEDALFDKIKDELKNDPEAGGGLETSMYKPWYKRRFDRGRDWHQNHYFDDHETFQWLFYTCGVSPTGPEQIWIQLDYSGSSGTVGLGQHEPVATFQVTAGSLHLPYSRGDWCVDGQQIGKLQQLAVTFPGLWKWRCISLGEFEFFTFSDALSGSPGPWKSIATKPIQSHADSPRTFQILQDWLTQCRTSHSHCQAAAPVASALPSRVVDVGPPDGSQSPRLYIRGEKEIVRYTILSHCWAPSHPCLQLLGSNLESLQHHLEFLDLPKTFQDAIVITRALKIRYLWVDTICVLQDSPSDLVIEYSKRNEYYSNSDLRIAATVSPYSQHGILHPRSIGQDSARLAGEAENIGVRPIAEDISSLIRRQRIWSKRPPVSNQPLESQSHAFLERIFAKSSVHFTEQQMVWQCQTCLVGEDGQIGQDRVRFTDFTCKEPFDFYLKTFEGNITAANENEHHRFPDMSTGGTVISNLGDKKYSLDETLLDTNWYSLLAEYTAKSMDDSSKVLVDLSSLARLLGDQTKATYLAGLWATDGQIPFRSLLWFCQKPGIVALNGSPSWAWSSVLGKVSHVAQWQYRMDHPGGRSEWLPRNAQKQYQVITYACDDSHIRILSAKTDLATSDPFGKVQGGELQITGLVHIFTGADQWEFAAERNTSPKGPTLHLKDIPADQIAWTRKTFKIGSNSPDDQGKLQTDDPSPNAPKKDEQHQLEVVDEDIDDDLKKEEEAEEKPEPIPFALTEHLDTEIATEVDWTKHKHLLLLVAEFRDSLDASQPPGIPPSDRIWFIILRQVARSGNRYIRIGTAELERKGRVTGLWGVHSAYTEANGWTREELVLV